MMKRTDKSICSERRAAVLIVSMIFVLVFSMLALSMAAMSGTNVQVSSNQHKINSALTSAQSGLECGKYLISSYVPIVTCDGPDITLSQANTTWSALCSHVEVSAIGGATVSGPSRFSDAFGSGDELVTAAINFGAADAAFQVRFYRYDADPYTIELDGIGTNGQVTRRAGINLAIEKNTNVLNYAVASRSRVIITGDSTIDGDIYSTWDSPRVAAPFEMEQVSTVNGTLNTAVSKSCFDPESPDYVGYTLETLDANGNPMFDEDGNRIYSPGDRVQGAHEGINYSQSDPQVAGFDYTDYDTSSYESVTSDIPPSSTKVWEFFPHKPGDYSQRQDWGSALLRRHVYENQTFTNKRLPKDRNALFINCTFEGVFFVEADSHVGWWSSYNNVRFEDCVFNGIIVTDVPDDFQATRNVLYFTGSSLFDNDYMEEATVLAPNFNVNIGNTKELEDEDESVLTGLVVGGIVDVRGNANINGTILSMFTPPGGWFSGVYATNVGFSDENFESGIPEDIGTIHIHPDADRMLPAGMTSNIILVPDQESYTEY